MRTPFFALTLALSATALTACHPKTDASPVNDPGTKTQTEGEDNPLLVASSLQYEAPAYDAIEFADFRPAFERGMEAHSAEIAAITSNEEPPSFENTVVAMERAGAILNRTADVFFSLTGTVSNDEIRALEAEMAPLLSAHGDSIVLDPALFARVEAVYEGRDSLQGEDLRLVEKVYEDFVRAGAKLDEAAKAEIREINAELSKLTTQFSQNLLAAGKAGAVVVEDKARLAGLSENDIAALAAAGEAAGMPGKYVINLLNTTQQPVLASLEDRALRQQIFEASAERAAQNGPVLLQIVELRARKAALLGEPTWANYVLGEQMAKTPEAVLKMLDDLAPRVVDKAKAEAEAIEKAIAADEQRFELEPWDWAYYAEKVRAKQFDLDENEVRAYFELERVMKDGLFFAMGELFGIRFEERTDLPTYHPDVRTFEVFDADGTSVGLFYADYFAREGKRGGAWMNAIVGQSELLGRKPVIVNVLNVPKPPAGQPTLLTFDEVGTMFHEMGHAVHGLFSEATYPSLAGTAVPRDYVEFPSQFEEDWAIDTKVLANFAKHYQTGEAIPPELLDKLLASREFNQGFASLEYIAAALLDMEWHMIPADAKISDVDAFEHQALAKHGVDFAPVPPRYRSNYFAHTFAGGYSAGYYAYLWTEVLAADAFAYMGTQGGLTRANGDRFRELILSKGNTVDPMTQYVNYRGQEPTVDALLVRRGLVDE
ncbi:M3 family metallopeptidase [Pseudenhygromyxa sp. WMMC2535]|uniref:M3 family metallopeptidase n=1 Tax=Pseudenhygromyxa sp. WMMC2535 TaxID=2712867 RepID=UPI0015527415|nr:M3 family metallopeptidase [Pseudenhygromyxa sp. WMMC2535]NVB37572.1 M3 family metallopeptidase [Pseudenhygromyxa sp. WMMC2535]